MSPIYQCHLTCKNWWFFNFDKTKQKKRTRCQHTHIQGSVECRQNKRGPRCYVRMLESSGVKESVGNMREHNLELQMVGYLLTNERESCRSHEWPQSKGNVTFRLPPQRHDGGKGGGGAGHGGERKSEEWGSIDSTNLSYLPSIHNTYVTRPPSSYNGVTGGGDMSTYIRLFL